jgi:hypothetical protein
VAADDEISKFSGRPNLGGINMKPEFKSLRQDYWHPFDVCLRSNHYSPDAKEFHEWIELRKINWGEGKLNSSEVFALSPQEMDSLVDFWKDHKKK